MSQEIKKITVRDYKGVRGTVDIEPDGKRLLVVAGPNGAGKSSFLGGVSEVFDPKGISLTKHPINHGATEASVEITTDKARLLRTWKPDKDGKQDAGTLQAFALDGAKYPSGKQFVLEATGGAVFNTKDFVTKDAKAQRDQLLALVDLPFDLTALDARRKALFDGRTDVARDVKKKAAQLAGMPPADPAVPSEEVSATDILAEHAAAREHNEKITRAMNALGQLDSTVEHAEANVARLVDELDAARNYLETAQSERTRAYDEFKAGPDVIDTDAITAKLTNVEETNAKVRAQASRAAVAAEHAALAEQEENLTVSIDSIDKQKADGLASAAFPVKGLSVDDEGITSLGVPFKQVNTATKTIIAFDLLTKVTPDLRIAIIEDGDSLDADSLAGIQKIADERDYYVLVERDRDESRAIASAVFSNGSLVNS